MSKLNNVYKDVYDLCNIAKAGRKAAKDKKYQKDVVYYRNNQTELDKALSESLCNKSYILKNEDYIVFDKLTSSGKWRKLKKLDFYPHRVTQHAILNVVEPKWVKSLTFDSYNCIKGRGINSKSKNHNFTKKLKRALLDPYSTYAFQADISQFYHTISNKKMEKEYRIDVKDKDLMWLLNMHNYSTENLPIGGPDSQIRSHLVLRKLDRFIKEELKVKYYLRYADDFVILSDSKQDLQIWQWRIMNFLYYKLKLTTKGNRRIVPVKNGVDICGYVFYPGYTRLRRRIKKNIVNKRNKESSLASYNGILKHCNSKNLVKKIINNNNRHMDITQLGIKLERPFDGENIKIEKLVDETISILDFEVRDSTKNKGQLWVRMQVMYNGEKRFVKGGYNYIASFLLQLEKQLIGDKDGLDAKAIELKKQSFLPLTNVIIRNNRGYYFEGTLN